MTYFDIVNQAIAATVTTDEFTGITYLEPLYKELLRESEIEFDEKIISMEELYEILKLEVKKRNAVNNSVMPLANSMASLMTEKIDPVVEEENRQLTMDMLKYFKERNELREKEKELENKEKAIDIKKMSDGMLNFSKKN